MKSALVTILSVLSIFASAEPLTFPVKGSVVNFDEKTVQMKIVTRTVTVPRDTIKEKDIRPNMIVIADLTLTQFSNL